MFRKYAFSFLILTACCELMGRRAMAQSSAQPPNILFIVMDDVGIDQLKNFGYGGLTPAPTPALDAIARNGIRFRNVWAMPECSPSRAMFYEGRYPFRTNVYNAIVNLDLANSQVSPYETTTPRLLKNANYKSSMIGKFHLSGVENNPYGDGAPLALGWDYFFGYLEPAPKSIDTTAGGIAVTGSNGGVPSGPYTCGFVPNSSAPSGNGADVGACYFANNQGCDEIARNAITPTPGRSCLERGGIFVPNDTCHITPPLKLQFENTNAYYVWPLVIERQEGHSVNRVPLTDPRARTYSATEITTEAIRWINSQPANQPWMTTVAYANIHTPYQQPPSGLLPPGSTETSDLDCENLPAQRILGNQMLTAMDTEIGRLLVGTGLAMRDWDGTLVYSPAASNTMVIVIGDNGTLANSVKAPFDPNRAKATVYQTGVWVPLLVAGPLVNSPGRDVDNMVNVGDLFELFGEIAGLDVRKIVPSSHQLDSASMLPYLKNPTQPSIRTYSFTQTGNNLRAQTRPGTCVIGNMCSTLVTSESLCNDNGGKWHAGVTSCCDLPNANVLSIEADLQTAVRNDKYKLVETQTPNCRTGQEDTTYEFFAIDQAVPVPHLDRASDNLLASPKGLNAVEQANYDALYSTMTNLLQTQMQCPGDGNIDGVVDETDIDNWKTFHKRGSSWYDFNLDGLTDHQDFRVIQDNLGKHCPLR